MEITEIVCSKCNMSKPVDNFGKETRSKTGYRGMCKECISLYRKDYYKGKDRNKWRKRTGINWSAEKRRLWENNRRNTDEQFKASKYMRTKLWQLIKLPTNTTFEYTGCNIQFLKEHLQSKFTNEMNWDNYGRYWQIDHIKPLSKFDLTNEEGKHAAFHYSNLQPLTGEDNRLKKDN